MKSYKSGQFASMPGPGDPETWGPYSGHPLDPRQPAEDDSTTREETRFEIIRERITGSHGDIGWFTEAVEDVDVSILYSLVDGYLDGDMDVVRKALDTLIDYAAPCEEDITDAIRNGHGRP